MNLVEDLPSSSVVSETVSLYCPLPALVAAFTRTRYSVKISSPSIVTVVLDVKTEEYSICDEACLNCTIYRINPFQSLSGSAVQTTTKTVGETAVTSRFVGVAEGTSKKVQYRNMLVFYLISHTIFQCICKKSLTKWSSSCTVVSSDYDAISHIFL